MQKNQLVLLWRQETPFGEIFEVRIFVDRLLQHGLGTHAFEQQTNYKMRAAHLKDMTSRSS